MKNSFKIAVLVAIAVLFAGATAARADIIVLQGDLTAAQVVDGGGSTSTATGFATVTIDTVLMTMTTDLSWSGLTGPADRAHVHDAPEGVSRTVSPNDRFFHEVINDADRTIACSWSQDYPDCVPASGSLYDEYDLTQQISPFPGCDPTKVVCDINQFENMALTDGLYVDIHTELFRSGELRGQLLATTVPEPGAVWLLGFGLVLLVLWRSIPARLTSL